MIPSKKQVSSFSSSSFSTSLPILVGLFQTVLKFWKWKETSPPFLSPIKIAKNLRKDPKDDVVKI
jgi:hypothetical protein